MGWLFFIDAAIVVWLFILQRSATQAETRIAQCGPLFAMLVDEVQKLRILTAESSRLMGQLESKCRDIEVTEQKFSKAIEIMRRDLRDLEGKCNSIEGVSPKTKEDISAVFRGYLALREMVLANESKLNGAIVEINRDIGRLESIRFHRR